MATKIPQNVAHFSLDEVLLATGGVLAWSGAKQARSVTTDSRELTENSLFVALRGERFDAHDFLFLAVQAGASLLVVEACAKVDELIRSLEEGTGQNPPSVVVVGDTLLALGKLAGYHRARFSTKIVAIAGSAGKTTTRSVISAMLEQAAPARVLSTRGNLNNRIGVPMTLLGLSTIHEYAAIEVGTNCPGEVRHLAAIVRPDVSVLTLIDLEHTEGLGDLDGVEREEAAIFEFLPPSGVAIGYGEDLRVRRRVAAAPCERHLTYGQETGHSYQIVSRVLRSVRRSEIVLKRDDGSLLQFESPLVGLAGALAITAGVAGVESLTGVRLSSEQCAQALTTAGEPGRHSLVSLPLDRWLVDDSYNSNPASVEHSVRTGQEIAVQTGGRLWLVLGEMLELGSLSAASHRQMGELAARSGAIGTFFVQGDAQLAFDACQGLGGSCWFYADSRDVASRLAPLVQSKDVVVVKASRGVRAERVVEGLSQLLDNPPFLS